MNIRTQAVLEMTHRTVASIPAYSPVILSTDTEFVETTTTANAAAVYGVTMQTSEAGGEVRVCLLGLCPVRIATAASCAVGDLLATHTTAGTAVEATAGQNSFAKVLVAPGANSDVVTCFVNSSSRG